MDKRWHRCLMAMTRPCNLIAFFQSPRTSRNSSGPLVSWRWARSSGGAEGSMIFSIRGLFRRSEQYRTCASAELWHTRIMALEAKEFTFREFASLLLAVGNAVVRGPAPAIPAEHSARLIALGYMADLEGRLRMTTPGRVRIAAGY
jgi:hypothetical protein